jgi:4-hydroxythreonine-4-phosphate dehydrogenase
LNTATPAILVSTGEPAGIGPDICVELATRALAGRPVFLGDAATLERRAASLDIKLALRVIDGIDSALPHTPGVMQLIDIPVAERVEAGTLNAANARHVLALLDRGAALCTSGAAAALVTAPVQKSIINEAGIPFSGHTEYLAKRTGAELPVMMLACDALKVALLTTHLPLADVPRQIDAARLEATIRVLDTDLKRRFGIAQPRIRVLGLNPHAGERGVLGREEIEIISPTLNRLRESGFVLLGPTPADTAFTTDALTEADVVLAMYHDQGLPVIKALGFGAVVNVTLGLPIIRTSVDHGTALELAATGRARADSLAEAYALAVLLAGCAPN